MYNAIRAIVEAGNCVYCGRHIDDDKHIFLCEECRKKEEEMSILIRGMKMPKGNSTINVLIYADGTVYTGHVNDSRYSAVSVPTPHGRLIDADKLIEELKECMDAAYDNWEYGTATGYSNSIESVEDAPTIIEAKGSEE